jgi:reactive chlorine resistance protein C
MQAKVAVHKESAINRLVRRIAGLDRLGRGLLRGALVLVLLWIGGIKFVPYEAESIVPLVANSPALSFFYTDAHNYRSFTNREGELNPSHRQWHQFNRTYMFSDGLGFVIILIACLVALFPFSPRLSLLGSFLLILMSLTTLSFLITTPEAWVPALGDQQHGFPYLSGVGRLVIKDTIMLAAAVVTLADAAKEIMRRRTIYGG